MAFFQIKCSPTVKLPVRAFTEFELTFAKTELRSYTNVRKLGRTKKLEDWIERASRKF